MKQNSRIMFNRTCKALTKSYLAQAGFAVFSVIVALYGLPGAKAADKPQYLASFDPTKGFKPAHSDLTEVVLQIAGSLKAYGSPEP